jgi:hypothetical protein
MSSFPLDVPHLEEFYRTFKSDEVEVIKRQVRFHGLAELLRGLIKTCEFRWEHDTTQDRRFPRDGDPQHRMPEE